MRTPATSTAVGQIERKTQDRVVRLFQHTLGYDYLGNWKDQPRSTNIEEPLLRAFLKKMKHSEALINGALFDLSREAGNTSKSLYDRNRAVYELLRYGVKVKTGVADKTETVWLVDWKHPENNHFGLAEEVTVKPLGDAAHEKRPDIVLYVNGLALGVLELKRSTVSMAEGIRQNLDNQKKSSLSHSSQRSSLSWPATTPRGCVTARSRPRKSITSPGKKKATSRTCWTGSLPRCAARLG